MWIIPLCTCNQLGWTQNKSTTENEGKAPTPFTRPRQSHVMSGMTMAESEVTFSNLTNKILAIPGGSQSIDIILPHENMASQ